MASSKYSAECIEENPKLPTYVATNDKSASVHYQKTYIWKFLGLLPAEQNFAPIWSLEITPKHYLVSQVFEIPRYLHMILHKIICLAYFIRWAIPDLSPVLVVSSQVGQKDAGKRKLSSPPPPFPAPSPTINLVKRLELEDCLLLLAAAILGYVLSNPGEKTRHASFVQPPFNLASSLH